MARVKKIKSITYKELLKMAEEWGVSDNALFKASAHQYIIQQTVLDKIEKALESDELLTEKEYVKGRENVYAHPLIKELPKVSDSANKVLNTMLNIIVKTGEKPIRDISVSSLFPELYESQ